MKKIILWTFILISFLAFPLLSHASYIIHLKDGGQFITSQYWEENGQIKFFVSGGTMGIEKNTVRKIEKSKLDVEDSYETDKPASPSKTIGNKPTREVIETVKEDRKTEVNKGNIKDHPGKDKNVMSEYRRLQIRYESRSSLSLDELKDLGNDLITLRDRIVSGGLADNFAEEQTKLYDMKFFIDDLIIIKSKTH